MRVFARRAGAAAARRQRGVPRRVQGRRRRARRRLGPRRARGRPERGPGHLVAGPAQGRAGRSDQLNRSRSPAPTRHRAGTSVIPWPSPSPPSSNGAPSTWCAAWPWTPPTGPVPGTRARPWRWRRWGTCCGAGCSATTPADPAWPDRDRLVLSAGHASILLYSYPLPDRLRPHARRTSRPSASGVRARRATPRPATHAGVEVTTGPLGQGLGNAVGMALAERLLRARFGAELCDHHTYVICSDGDMMEGVSHEAASLAGHLGLGRLIAVYDDNHITIDGPTSLAFSDDTAARFEAYGWHVQRLGEAERGPRRTRGRPAAGRPRRPSDRRSSSCAATSAYPSPSHTDDPGAHGYVITRRRAAAGQGGHGPAGRAVLRARRRRRPLPPRRRPGPRRARGPGRTASSPSRGPTRRSGTPTTPPWPAAACPAGPRSCRPSQAGEKLATRVASGQCLNAVGRRRARPPAGRRGPHRQHRHRA